MVLVGFASLAFAGDPEDDGAYETELDVLQQRIDAAQEDEQPRHPTSRERGLEAALAEMQDRAVRAEASLATCQTELAEAKK
jgi:hypothetical protein